MNISIVYKLKKKEGFFFSVRKAAIPYLPVSRAASDLWGSSVVPFV